MTCPHLSDEKRPRDIKYIGCYIWYSQSLQPGDLMLKLTLLAPMIPLEIIHAGVEMWPNKGTLINLDRPVEYEMLGIKRIKKWTRMRCGENNLN